jgi:chitinase
VPALPYLTRTTLSHDVIDAEYSAALDAIVMVSAKPTSSLYIYDTATGTEREVRLNRVPTAVSISPDGQTAAVGHDAMLSIVELASAGQPGAPAPVVLNLSADAFDVVLDGRGFVHAFPRVDQWVVPHSVEIAANVERLGTGSLYAGSRAKLHPSGNFVYTANNGLSPSDIAKYDIRGSSAVELYDSPYHGDYAMCGDLWMKQDGAVVYTKCGNTFRSSTTQAQDMVYNGRLQLSEVAHGFFIDSLSQSDASDEIALLESPWYSCTFNQSGCYSHLNLYESEFLNRTAMYSLAPVTVDINTYSQQGLFVFHSADGLHRYLISRLSHFPGENQPYYLTVLQ